MRGRSRGRKVAESVVVVAATAGLMLFGTVARFEDPTTPVPYAPVTGRR